MPRLSFRFKLLFAMMLVVMVVSLCTLLLTQKRVQAAYNRVFREKVEAQITYLPKEQEARLSAVRQRCEEVAKSVRLQAAFDAGDVDQLYQTALDELSTILRKTDTPLLNEAERRALEQRLTAATPAPLRAKSPALQKARDAAKRLAARKPTVADLCRFLDAKGQILRPSEDLAVLFRIQGAVRPRLEAQLTNIGAAVEELDTQQVGYIYVEMEEDKSKSRILEVVVTPVVDSTTRKTLGTLVLGFPFLDLGEERISEVSDIENGVWLDGRLYTRTIQETTRRELNQILVAEIPTREQSRDDLLLVRDGIPHRVFYTALNSGSPLPKAYKVGLYSWATAVKAQEELRNQILLLSGLALLIALGISVLLSHGLAVPLLELVDGTAQVQKGNFNVRVPVRGRDEIGRLAASFNEMTAGLALKEKYHSILHTIADKDVAQQLLDGKIALGGELREATVMFCDIRGFTALTQNMNPTEVIALLNEHMTALTRIVTEHHGVVDKFIGDSIMAIFGAPKNYGNDALNAVRCAERMMAERAKLNETSRYKIQMGVGLASGRVLAGNMGSADRSNYTVLGERVNLAARLCSVARRGEIVIGPTTRGELGDLIAVEEMDPLQLKGFSDSIVAFKLLEVRTESQPAVQPV